MSDQPMQVYAPANAQGVPNAEVFSSQPKPKELGMAEWAQMVRPVFQRIANEEQAAQNNANRVWQAGQSAASNWNVPKVLCIVFACITGVILFFTIYSQIGSWAIWRYYTSTVGSGQFPLGFLILDIVFLVSITQTSHTWRLCVS